MHAVTALLFSTCLLSLATPDALAQADTAKSDSSRGIAPRPSGTWRGIPLFSTGDFETPRAFVRALDSLRRENPHLQRAILRYLVVTTSSARHPPFGHESFSQQLQGYTGLTPFESMSLVASRHQEQFGHTFTYGMLGQLSLTGLIKYLVKAIK